MPDTSGKSRQYIVIGLIVIVLILSAVLIYFQFNIFTDLRAEVEDEELALLAAQSQLSRLMEHRDNASEYEQRMAYAKQMVPDRDEEDYILRKISSLADDHNLRTIEISFDGRNETEQYTQMPLSITMEGKYQDIRSMLRQLHHGDRAIRVYDIRLSRSGGSESTLNISLSASAFYNHNN